MKRFIAYSFDVLITSPIIVLLHYLVSDTTKLNIDYIGFYLITFPIIISIFEYKYCGKTPGKFIMRIKTVLINENEVPLLIYFKRSAYLIYFIPITIILLTVFFEIFLNTPLHTLEIYYSTVLYILLICIPWIMTFGSQCFHDYIFGTKVISDNTKNVRMFNSKYAYRLIISLLVILTSTIYYVHGYSNKVIPIVNEKLSSEELEMKSILNFNTSLLEKNVDNLFEYYADLYGYVGMRELGELDNSIGIQTPPVFTFTLDHPQYVPVFRVFVTRNGLLNRRFKDTVTRNILEYTMDKVGSKISVVEFIHQEKYFGLFYLLIKQINVGVYTSNLNQNGNRVYHSMVLSPKESGYISFSNTKIPLWQIK